MSRVSRVVREDAGRIAEKLIDSQGLKKTFVARKVGTSPQNLYNRLHYESIDADLAFKIAEVLKVNPSIFLSKSYRDNLNNKD